MSEASLAVNGTVHSGWQEVSVTRSLEQFAATFDISFTEQWSGQKEAIPIREGDTCTLKLDDKAVIAGYVDDASIDYDANDHTMRVTGRSITGDLVDCSAIYKKGHWKKRTLKAIAKDLCTPFGIGVIADSSLGDMGGEFPTFSIQDGETVFETIERACRMRGLLMMSTATGKLRFAGVGTKSTQTVLENGVNIIRGGRSGSWKDRYSAYTLKAQAPGGEDVFGRAVAQQKATASDGEVTRYRPLVLTAETHMGTAAKLKERVNWERNVRAGRAQRLRYTVDGWENAEGLWEPNTLVRVKDKLLQVDTQLLVISVRQSKNENGTNTDLEVGDPRSMTVQPLTKQPKGNSKYLEYLRGSK